MGTALSATQLDATANVPGNFMYNPAVGAVLAAGTQQLTAVFSPTDATDYASATAHASLVVGSPSNPNPPTNPNPPSVPLAPAVRSATNSSDGMRRSHHQREQRHEPEHTAEHNLQRSELCTDRLCGGHLQHQQPAEYPLRGEPYADRAAPHPSDSDSVRNFATRHGIFSTYPDCTADTTVWYLTFENTGGIYVSDSVSKYNRHT